MMKKMFCKRKNGKKESGIKSGGETSPKGNGINEGTHGRPPAFMP
jgi:hypothetical protein